MPVIADNSGVIEEIQQSTLAMSLPQCPGLSVDAMTLPAPDSAGAYFDLIQARKNRVIAIVAEAGGPGLQASLVLVMLKSILTMLGKTDKNMAAVLDWGNRVLDGIIDTSHAPSVGLAGLNLLTGELEYANAGRMSMLVYRQGTKALDYISKASVPIGKQKVVEYERIRLQLQHGDLVLLYTDGVTGCLDDQGNQFGRSALAKAMVRHAGSNAVDVTAGIRSALSAFSGTTVQQTDQTILVFKLE